MHRGNPDKKDSAGSAGTPPADSSADEKLYSVYHGGSDIYKGKVVGTSGDLSKAADNISRILQGSHQRKGARSQSAAPPPDLPRKKIQLKGGLPANLSTEKVPELHAKPELSEAHDSEDLRPKSGGEAPEFSESERKHLLRKIFVFNQDHRAFCSPRRKLLTVDRWPLEPELLRAPLKLDMSQVRYPRRIEIIGAPAHLEALDDRVTAHECRLLVRPIAFRTEPGQKVEFRKLYELGFWAILMPDESGDEFVYRLFGLGPDSIIEYEGWWQYSVADEGLVFETSGRIYLLAVQQRRGADKEELGPRVQKPEASHLDSTRSDESSDAFRLKSQSGLPAQRLEAEAPEPRAEEAATVAESELAPAETAAPLVHDTDDVASQMAVISGFSRLLRDMKLRVAASLDRVAANTSSQVIILCRDGSFFQRSSSEQDVSASYTSADGSEQVDVPDAQFAQGIMVGGRAFILKDNGETYQTDRVVAIAYRPNA